MKKARIVTKIGYTGSLGMLALNIEDQEGNASAFHFLPAHFKAFAQTTAQVERQAVPADMQVAAPLPKMPSAQLSTAAAAAKWSQSQSAAFAVMTNPVENLAFLCLRQASGDEAVVPLDAETIDKLITHLRAAQDAIRPAAAGRH